jgi:hypothetical protein
MTALDVLREEFHEDQAKWLLWNFTCFPFDNEMAISQARQIIRDKRQPDPRADVVR